MSNMYSVATSKFPKPQKKTVKSGRGVPSPDPQFSTLSDVKVATGGKRNTGQPAVGYHRAECY